MTACFAIRRPTIHGPMVLLAARHCSRCETTTETQYTNVMAHTPSTAKELSSRPRHFVSERSNMYIASPVATENATQECPDGKLRVLKPLLHLLWLSNPPPSNP
jgi:hypothetical protein